jgi:hypothetical protein
MNFLWPFPHRGRVRPLWVLAVLLLAGCSTPATPSPSGGGVAAPRFAAPVDVGTGGPEPVVVVADDGTVFLAAQDAAGGAPHVWVSGDGGASFEATSPSTQGGGEVDLASGAGALLYFTQLGPNGNIVARSADKGGSWSSAILGATQYFDREWVTIDGSTPFIVARDFQKASAVVSRSDDGGVTFLPRGTAWDGQHEPGTTNGNLLAYAGGLALVYVCRDGDAVCLAQSGDGGATWSQHVVVARSTGVDNTYPVVAADGRRLVVVWSDASSGALAVWDARSDDDGASWSRPAQVSAGGESGTLAWVASGGGATWVAYASTPGSLARADDAGAKDARWSVEAARLDDASLAVTQRGPATGVVHVGVISKPVGAGGQSGLFDRSFGDFFTVAVDARGRALVAVVDTTRGAAHDLLATQP